jgi:hypothetical protein
MARVNLDLRGEVFAVPALVLCQVCANFPTHPLPERYPVQSRVSREVFQKFLAALQGESIEVTKATFPGFSALCDEFGFELESTSFRLGQVEAAVESLKSVVDQLLDQVRGLNDIRAVTNQLADHVARLRSWTLPIGSQIVSDFPGIFAEFEGKRFELLWRGSRDGFEAKEFHRRCDDHANTLTVILDTKGNIFGGFTPVKWESRVWNGKRGNESNTQKADDDLKSFLFTLMNPHNNMPARRFVLQPEKREVAIRCNSQQGPFFGNDIGVSDNCNTNNDSNIYFGHSYTNDTGLDGKVVFTGAQNFQVKEIEVFEIT